MSAIGSGAASFGRLRAALSRLDDARGPGIPDFCAGVREVILVASSSRGGSSMFTEMLRGLPGLLHFRGEINIFLLQACLTWPATGTGSDRLDAGMLAEAAG